MALQLPKMRAGTGWPIELRTQPVLEISDDDFFEICAANPDLKLERNRDGDFVLMAPTGSGTGCRNAAIVAMLYSWNQQHGRGLVFDSDSGFRLPIGSIRAPDAAWIERDRFKQLPPNEIERFAPICPDFIIELRSPSDELPPIQAKMDEYIESGARLGWLIDPLERRIHVYRPGQAVEILDDPASVSGDPELPGFRLDLPEIWNPIV